MYHIDALMPSHRCAGCVRGHIGHCDANVFGESRAPNGLLDWWNELAGRTQELHIWSSHRDGGRYCNRSWSGLAGSFPNNNHPVHCAVLRLLSTGPRNGGKSSKNRIPVQMLPWFHFQPILQLLWEVCIMDGSLGPGLSTGW